MVSPDFHQADFHRDNHYVPCEYLKAWEASPGRLWLYRVLVSHGKVPLWNEKSIRGVAYHAHLYTRLAIGGATDEIEQWFDREYETPAAEVLQKVVSDSRLSAIRLAGLDTLSIRSGRENSCKTGGSFSGVGMSLSRTSFKGLWRSLSRNWSP